MPDRNKNVKDILEFLDLSRLFEVTKFEENGIEKVEIKPHHGLSGFKVVYDTSTKSLKEYYVTPDHKEYEVNSNRIFELLKFAGFFFDRNYNAKFRELLD